MGPSYKFCIIRMFSFTLHYKLSELGLGNLFSSASAPRGSLFTLWQYARGMEVLVYYGRDIREKTALDLFTFAGFY